MVKGRNCKENGVTEGERRRKDVEGKLRRFPAAPSSEREREREREGERKRERVN